MDEHPRGPGHHEHDHDRGLHHDLPLLVGRRRTLTLLAGAGLIGLAGCGVLGDNNSSDGASRDSTSSGNGAGSGRSSASTPTSDTSDSEASCESAIPEETAGPHPADGSNGVNVLGESGVVRSDNRSSFGGSSTTAEGVPFTVTLTILDLAKGCAPLPGAAVYLWHCDREGRYSLYSEDEGVADENYLRAVQPADGAGKVTFTSIFPAA